MEAHVAWDFQALERLFFCTSTSLSAESWVLGLASHLGRAGVVIVNADLCRFSLQVDSKLAKKQTTFTTNSKNITVVWANECARGHAHVQLVGGLAARPVLFQTGWRTQMCHTSLALDLLLLDASQAKRIALEL